MTFREDVAEVIQAPVSLSRPAQFLRAPVEVSAERNKDLSTAVKDSHNEDLRAAVGDLTDSLMRTPATSCRV